MSRPVTTEEHAQEELTLGLAGPAENVVSTACPACHTRFAMLATLRRNAQQEPTWYLRCTRCGHQCQGELKS